MAGTEAEYVELEASWRAREAEGNIQRVDHTNACSTGMVNRLRERDLQPGMSVRIKRTFHDVDGQKIEAGRVLTLERHDVHFYVGGHTLTFAGGVVIRLGDGLGESDAVLEDERDEYWEIVPA